MCYDNYPENNKYHRKKILQTTKGLFYLAVCRICSVIFVFKCSIFTYTHFQIISASCNIMTALLRSLNPRIHSDDEEDEVT